MNGGQGMPCGRLGAWARQTIKLPMWAPSMCLQYACTCRKMKAMAWTGPMPAHAKLCEIHAANAALQLTTASNNNTQFGVQTHAARFANHRNAQASPH